VFLTMATAPAMDERRMLSADLSAFTLPNLKSFPHLRVVSHY